VSEGGENRRQRRGQRVRNPACGDARRVKDRFDRIIESGQTAYVLRTLCIHMAERVHPDLPIFELETAVK